MYDSSSGYFLAARSACGREKFFWGTSEVREDIVLLSSVQDGLTDFPPGCMFEVCVHLACFHVLPYLSIACAPLHPYRLHCICWPPVFVVFCPVARPVPFKAQDFLCFDGKRKSNHLFGPASCT